MNCPKCKSAQHCKDGIVKGRQRYLCKECGMHYTVEKKSDVKTAEVRRMALEMYLEGLGFRAIGRILKISYGTVYRWIKEWGSKVSLPQNSQPIAVVEIDELHSYVGSKKTIVGYGLLLIDLQDGSSRLCVGAEAQKQEQSSTIILKR
ncbi:MAG: insertion element protein [Candidatus Parvibacillus calidus]|jgi:transposase-like protein|nr:MAG: insertion element protein [Candidatus Parvibacillus calidus]